MRLAVLGAAGRTGTATVRAAQGRGHAVVAIARRRLDDLPAGVKPAVADVTDANALLAALAGTDAVISLPAEERLGLAIASRLRRSVGRPLQ